MTARNLDEIIDGVQAAMIYLTIFLTAVCVLALMLFDVFAGSLSMMFMTQKNEWLSLGISLATTGLLLSLMIAAQNMKDNRPILIAAGIVYILDIIFDSMGADFMRYSQAGGFDVDGMQWMFRMLIGGISTVGDGIAFGIITGMPFVKELLRKALPKNTASYLPQKQIGPTTPYHAPERPKSEPYKPQHRPQPQKQVDKPREPSYSWKPTNYDLGEPDSE